jgi:hypothetical protein
LRPVVSALGETTALLPIFQDPAAVAQTCSPPAQKLWQNMKSSPQPGPQP